MKPKYIPSQMDEIIAENAELSEDVEGLDKTIDELESDIAALQAENERLTFAYNELEKRAISLQAENEQLRNILSFAILMDKSSERNYRR